MRKNYLLSLESRTPSQIAEEEALYIELKKHEQTERTFRRERDELLRTLLGIDSGLPDLPIEDDTGAPASAVESRSGAPEVAPNKKNNKRRGAGMTLGDLGGGIGGESPASPASAGPSALTPRSRQSSTKNSAYGALLYPLVRSQFLIFHNPIDALHCILRIEPDKSNNPAISKQAHQAASLRTFKIPYPKSALAGKVNQVITELGITLARLVMPTRDTLAAYDSLLNAATSLVDTKKVVDTVDQEIRVTKARLGMRFEAEVSGGGAGSGGNAGAANATGRPSLGDGESGLRGSAQPQGQTPAPMNLDLDDDVKMEEEEGRDGDRAQSVVSTRSARSTRRQVSCPVIIFSLIESHRYVPPCRMRTGDQGRFLLWILQQLDQATSDKSMDNQHVIVASVSCFPLL